MGGIFLNGSPWALISFCPVSISGKAMLFYEQPKSSRLYNTVQNHFTAFANITQVTEKKL